MTELVAKNKKVWFPACIGCSSLIFKEMKQYFVSSRESNLYQFPWNKNVIKEEVQSLWACDVITLLVPSVRIPYLS